ncbi:hypothetical protein KBC54_04370 [Patescibacteria group bacterium]|nr:hypothetical protein [Patescibacteria group bacterium]
MEKRGDLRLALSLQSIPAALSALLQPCMFEANGNDLTVDAINAARLAGRVILFFPGTDKDSWNVHKLTPRIKSQLKFFSRTPGELVLEKLYHDDTSTCIEVLCSVHPEPVPSHGAAKQQHTPRSRIGIPDSF